MERTPEPMPEGARPPPVPPKLTAIGLEDDDDKRRLTVSKGADGEGKFIRESAGRYQYGHVVIQIEPNKRDEGVTINSEVDERTIPNLYMKAISEGIRVGLESGCHRDGKPVVDVIVSVSGGSWKHIGSSELAYKMAGIFAVKDAVKKAGVVYVDQ